MSHTKLPLIAESKIDLVYAKNLTRNFLRQNPTWAIESLVSYCLKNYSVYGVTPSIISECIREYIDTRYPVVPQLSLI